MSERNYRALAAEAINVLSVVADTIGSEQLAKRVDGLTERLDACDAGMKQFTSKRIEETHEETDAQVTKLPPIIAARPALPDEKAMRQSPRSGIKARKLRLVGMKDGEPTGFVQEGTAAELARVCGLKPSYIYNLAASGAIGGRGKWRVEKVMETTKGGGDELLGQGEALPERQ